MTDTKLHNFIFNEWDIDATGSCEVLERFIIHLLATARAEGAAEERERIDKRIVELKELHQQLLDKFEQHRLEFKRNPDSISAKEKVISDENSGYICEIWGRLNELEALTTKEHHDK